MPGPCCDTNGNEDKLPTPGECMHMHCFAKKAAGSDYCAPCTAERARVWTEELAKREATMRRRRPKPRACIIHGLLHSTNTRETTYTLCKLIDSDESYMTFAQEWGNMRAWNKCLSAHEAEALVYGPNGMLDPQVFIDMFGLPQLIDWEFVATHLNRS